MPPANAGGAGAARLTAQGIEAEFAARRHPPVVRRQALALASI